MQKLLGARCSHSLQISVYTRTETLPLAKLGRAKLWPRRTVDERLLSTRYRYDRTRLYSLFLARKNTQRCIIVAISRGRQCPHRTRVLSVRTVARELRTIHLYEKSLFRGWRRLKVVPSYIYKAGNTRQESRVPATMYLINVTGARGAAGLERSDCTHKPPSIHSGERRVTPTKLHPRGGPSFLTNPQACSMAAKSRA